MTGSGNRCGHNPEKPRWFAPPDTHAARPGVLRRLIESIRDYYTAPDTFLPLLNACNGSDRQQRSERREACLSVLGCILHYTELASLRVGIPQADGSMAGLTMERIAELTQLGLRRAERAIHDLVQAGLVTVHPFCQKLDDATYKGYAAIRTVTQHLFKVFGLDKWLLHERRKAAERLKKKTRKADQRAEAQQQIAVAKLLHGNTAPVAPPPPPEERANRPLSASEYLANMKNTLGLTPKAQSA